MIHLPVGPITGKKVSRVCCEVCLNKSIVVIKNSLGDSRPWSLETQRTIHIVTFNLFTLKIFEKRLLILV
jgi:hypothetical protein